MKKIYLILSVFAIVFTACETDFDVNAKWEEVTVVYGLLDAGDEKKTQKIKINKAFLGKMDALQMAQYADSVNFIPNNLDVNIYRIKNGNIIDSIVLDTTIIIKDSLASNGIDPGIFSIDNNIIYTFENDNFLNSNSEYELVIKNKVSGKVVTSTTNIISGFKFDMPSSYQFGFVSNFTEGTPSATEFSSSIVEWGNSNDNGKIYQLDLVINYSENQVAKQLIYAQPLVYEQDPKVIIKGESFFNFLSTELTKDDTKVRYFNGIDLVMTVGSEDLDTYIKVNQPITGIVQERPQFTNIHNGIGLFSSRFTKISYNLPLTQKSTSFLKSIDGLDRNFQ